MYFFSERFLIKIQVTKLKTGNFYNFENIDRIFKLFITQYKNKAKSVLEKPKETIIKS